MKERALATTTIEELSFIGSKLERRQGEPLPSLYYQGFIMIFKPKFNKICDKFVTRLINR